jgi:hypothetical protein
MKHPSRNTAWLGVPLVVLCLLLPRAGYAAGEEDVRSVILSISRLYEEFEYEQALVRLQFARSLPRGPDDEATLSLYEGILLCEIGQFAKGETAFRTALLMKPDVTLPVRVAPKIDALFGSLRQEMMRKTVSSTVPPVRREQTPQVARSPAPVEPDVPLAPSSPLVAQLGENDEGRVKAQSPGNSRLLPAVGRPVEAAGGRASSGVVRKLSLIPAAAGVLLLVAGGVSLSVSHQHLEQLRTRDPNIQSSVDVRNVIASGQQMQTLGGSLLGGGALALVSAAGMFLWGGPTPKPLSLGLGVDGTSAFVQGKWP